MTRTRSLSTLLLASVLGTAALAQERQGRARDVAALLPEATLVHVMVSGGPCLEDAHRLALARILAEPEVRRFLEPLWAMVGSEIDELEGAMRDATGLDFEALRVLLRHPMTLSWLGDPSVPDVVFTLDCGPSQELVAGLIAQLEAVLPERTGLPPPDEVQLAGRAFKLLSLGDVEIVYGLADGLFVIGSHSATIASMLERLEGSRASGSLAAAPKFRAAIAHVSRPKSVIVAYVDVRRTLDLVLQEAPEEIRDALALWGFDGIEAIGYGLDLDGAGIRDRVYTHFGERRGWLGSSRPPAAQIRSHHVVPAETGFYAAGALAFDATFDGIRDVLERSYPKAARKLRAAVEQGERKLGLNLRDDLLSVLGPEYAVYASWPGQSLVPDIGVLLEVRDRARVAQALAKIEAALAADIEVRSFEYRGRRFRTFDLQRVFARGSGGADPVQLAPKPSIVLLDDFVLVTLWPQSAKNLIRGLDAGTPRLVDRPDFAKGLAHLQEEDARSGIAALSYVDLPGGAGFVLDQAAPLLQCLVPSDLGLPLDLAAFPMTEAITQHLFGIVGITRWDEDGISQNLYSPTGVIPVYAAFVGAGVLMMGQARSFESQVAIAAAGPVERGPVPRAPVMDRQQQARLDIVSLHNAVSLFLVAEGRLPNPEEWPRFLLEGSRNHPRPYLDPGRFEGGELRDPWGEPYIYRKQGSNRFQIQTLGADRKAGGVGPDEDLSTGKGR